MISKENISQFIDFSHKVGDAGLTVCSSGNISWRRGDEAMVTGTGSWIPELTEDKISICRISDGKSINGVKPSMEIGFHLGIMRMRPEVNVVLHFQSPYATAVSCMKDKPENFNVSSELPYHVGKEIPVVPYYLPGSEKLAAAVIEAFREHDAVLLASHGQVVCGTSFNDTFERAMFFEMACRIIILTGGRYDTLTADEIAEIERNLK